MVDYRYDNQTVKGFVMSSIFWGVVGIVIGLWISVQMWMPSWNIAPYFTFGRLRVVHTNGLAYGLGIGAIFGISYYIVMRLTKRPLLFPKLARFHLYLDLALRHAGKFHAHHVAVLMGIDVHRRTPRRPGPVQ